MRTTWKTLGACALALALAACGKQADDFTDATPDAAGLALELAGGTSEGLAAAPEAPRARLEAVAPDAVDELGSARESIAALDREVRRVQEQVAAPDAAARLAEAASRPLRFHESRPGAEPAGPELPQPASSDAERGSELLPPEGPTPRQRDS